MKNFMVVTPTPLVKREVQEFVKALGGYWNHEPTLDQGVIEREPAAIFVSVEVEIQPYDYEPSEIEELTRRIGAKPRSLVDLHISHADGSTELAEEVARLMIQRWGGYLDYNEPSPNNSA